MQITLLAVVTLLPRNRPTATLLLPVVLLPSGSSPNGGIAATVGVCALKRIEPDSRIPEGVLSTGGLLFRSAW